MRFVEVDLKVGDVLEQAEVFQYIGNRDRNSKISSVNATNLHVQPLMVSPLTSPFARIQHRKGSNTTTKDPLTCSPRPVCQMSSTCPGTGRSLADLK